MQLASAQQTNHPGWEVNPNLYQYSTTVTSKILLNNGTIPDGEVLLGAFAGNEVRGTATPLAFNGEKYFFLTVYTNSPAENITFKVYFGSTDTVLIATEQLAMVANGVYGSLSEPYLIHTFFQFNHTPVVAGIPDQSIEKGSLFTQINLNNFLNEQDNDPVVWSYRNNRYVEVTVAGSLASILYPADWTGKDTVIFRATENTAQSLFGEDTVVFTVLRTDNAPSFSNISGQVVGQNLAFSPVNIRSYITEPDGDSIAISYAYVAGGITNPVPTWSIEPSQFSSTMTITAEVIFPGITTDGTDNLLAAFSGNQFRGVASGINYMGKQLFFLTVYANNLSDTIMFRYYNASVQKTVAVAQKEIFESNAVLGTPLLPIALQAGNIIVSISGDGIATLSRPDPTWYGSERVRFIVRDIGTLHTYQDTVSAVYTVLQDHAPIISGIPNQAIVAPQAFSPINLNNYITESDGDNTSISILNNTHMQVSVDGGRIATISVTPNGWSGTEQVIFRITDNTSNALFSQDTVQFSARAIDNPPQFANIPIQETYMGGSFHELDLGPYVTESDGDSISFSYRIKQTTPNVTAPVWEINPSSFEQSMNITAVVNSAGVMSMGGAHLLAAFSGGILRGVATPLQFGEKWLYFLTVYANTAGEKITFKFYDAVMQKIYPVQGTITFASNAIVGSPTEPAQFRAGNILFTSLSGGVISAIAVDTAWSGTETLTVIARDAQTTNGYSDTTEVAFRVIDVAQLKLTILIEGLYRSAADTMAADTVTVLLRKSNGSFERVDSVKIYCNNAGQGVKNFAGVNKVDHYYIVVKHRNSIETWSKTPVQFINSVLEYDFTADSAKAYGNNMRLKGNRWCILSGDVDQDGFVDFTDMTRIDNAGAQYLAGYLPEDLNGDNFSDISDLIIADNSAYQYSMVLSPIYPAKRPVPNPTRTQAAK